MNFHFAALSITRVVADLSNSIRFGIFCEVAPVLGLDDRTTMRLMPLNSSGKLTIFSVVCNPVFTTAALSVRIALVGEGVRD